MGVYSGFIQLGSDAWKELAISNCGRGLLFQGKYIISSLVSEVGSIWLADPSYLTSKIMQMGRIDSDQEN